MRLPQTVGDYTLLQQLGSGSFGTVYRARIEGDLGFSQEVAVKLVDSRLSADRPDVIVALADEAQFLARLNHPHIVAVRRFQRVEHAFLGEVHLMEMELVRGVPLSRLLASVALENTRLPVDAVLSMVLEAVDALVYAHDLTDPHGKPMGLVHRDLKPDNLLVGSDGRLKVLDFGIAWAEERSAQTTGTGMAKGTPMYMAPEQARGEDADPRGDLYALGTIAFECLTGERYVALPKAARVDLPMIIMSVATTTFESRVGVLEQALAEPEPRGRGLSPELARPWVELLGRMLAREKADRPSDAAAVARALDDLGAAWKPHLGRRYLQAAVRDLVPAPPDTQAETVEAQGAGAAPGPLHGFRAALGDGAAEPTRISPVEERPVASRRSGFIVLAVGLLLAVIGMIAVATREGPSEEGGDAEAADEPVVAAMTDPEPTPQA
ncbi:MAG: serine/threonine protein kinase, partial [Deltaproteobacteria bacterium]|nr:serine/threonine protein kinase [Deltaproteobacteria bacterium]